MTGLLAVAQQTAVRYLVGLAILVAAAAVAAGFLVGVSRGNEADAAQLAQWERERGTLWATIGQISDSAVAAQKRAEGAALALTIARQATDAAVASSRRTAEDGKAAIADARARVASLTADNAARRDSVLREFDRVARAHDSLAAENARLAAAAAQERAGTDELLDAKDSVASLRAQLAIALDSAAKLERARPAPPRLRRSAEGGYLFTAEGGAPLGGLGLEYRLTDHLALHARGEYALPPVHEARVSARAVVYF